MSYEINQVDVEDASKVVFTQTIKNMCLRYFGDIGKKC